MGRERVQESEETDVSEGDPKLGELHSQLRIDKDDLDTELVDHARLVADVGFAHAYQMSRRDGFKQRMNETEIECRARTASAILKRGDKVTEKAIDAEIEGDPEWQSMRRRYLELCKQGDLWAALREAYNARGFALHDLAQLVISRNKAEIGTSER